MKKLIVTIGQDLSAYARVEVPAGTDISDNNLAEIAQKAIEDAVFDEDWSTATALRIVSVEDENHLTLRSEVQIEPSYYHGGAVLETFFKGKTTGIDALVNGAIEAKLIVPSELVSHTGCLTTPSGERIHVEFCVRKDATRIELDSAFFQTLCQQVAIETKAIEV